jgi:hypothetical protein
MAAFPLYLNHDIRALIGAANRIGLTPPGATFAFDGDMLAADADARSNLRHRAARVLERAHRVAGMAMMAVAVYGVLVLVFMAAEAAGLFQ